MIVEFKWEILTLKFERQNFSDIKHVDETRATKIPQ